MSLLAVLQNVRDLRVLRIVRYVTSSVAPPALVVAVFLCSSRDLLRYCEYNG
jgi:hypothetical protein